MDVLLVPLLTKWYQRVQQCSGLSTSLAVPTHALLTTPHLKPWQECDLGWGSSQVQNPNSLLVLARQLPCKQHRAQNSPKCTNAEMQTLCGCSGSHQVITAIQGGLSCPSKKKTSERTGRQTEGMEWDTDFLPQIPISPPKRQKQINLQISSKSWK